MDDRKFQQALNASDFEAAESFIKALTKVPKWKKDCYWAALYLKSDKSVLAEQHLQRALIEADKEYLPRFLFAQFLLKTGEGARAIQYARHAVELNPKSQDCVLLLIQALMDNAQTGEALNLIETLSVDKQNSKGIIFARVSALRSEGRHSEALEIIRKYHSSDPNDVTALRLEADIVADSDSVLGLALYEKAIELNRRKKKPEDAALKWNSALHYLRARDFQRGWENWEFGFSPKVGTLGRKVPQQLRRLKRVVYDQDISKELESWLLVVPEQGVGDQVLFLSALNELALEHPRLILVADHRLYPVLKRSFPLLTIAYPGIIDDWDKLALPSLGYLPYGSILPRYRRTNQSFERDRAPFLLPNQKNTERIRASLVSKQNGRRIIGISWTGGFWSSQKRNKSLDPRVLFDALDKDCTYVNLQYGDTQKERKLAQDLGIKLISFEGIDFTQNLDFWTDIIAAVDQVISVSTALVHFAGAMGKRVDILLPEKQGPWILGLDDTQHIVYERVFVHREVSPDILPMLLKEVSNADL